MDVKFGKLRPNSNNLSINPLENSQEENIFAASPEFNFNQNNQQEQTAEKGTRINDYDSSILEKNAYQTLPDETFKLEHKINLLENSLAKINTEIETLESLNYDIQVYDLRNRKAKIEQELNDLKKQYANFGIGSKISNQIASAITATAGNKDNIFSKAGKIITRNVLAKVSKTVGYNQTMKEALDNLNNINNSVDELIQMQTPYGEDINRYEKLTAYLNKANKIHSAISKNINARK